MLKLFSFSLLVLMHTASFAQKNSGKQSVSLNTTNDMAILHTLNGQFIQNFLHNDTVAHNKIIYKDFLCISSSGAVIDRNDYMKGWAHGYDPGLYKSFVMQNEFIRVMDNTALVRAETKYSYMEEGKEVFKTTLYTDTYVKMEGRWWCIQAQLTKK